MQDEDRAFLREFASRTCYTHPVAAFALHRAAVDADEIGIVAESFLHLVDRPAAETIAASSRTAALVQTFVVARLWRSLLRLLRIAPRLAMRFGIASGAGCSLDTSHPRAPLRGTSSTMSAEVMSSMNCWRSRSWRP